MRYKFILISVYSSLVFSIVWTAFTEYAIDVAVVFLKPIFSFSGLNQWQLIWCDTPNRYRCLPSQGESGRLYISSVCTFITSKSLQHQGHRFDWSFASGTSSIGHGLHVETSPGKSIVSVRSALYTRVLARQFIASAEREKEKKGGDGEIGLARCRNTIVLVTSTGPTDRSYQQHSDCGTTNGQKRRAIYQRTVDSC